MARLRFLIKSREQLQHIFAAESELLKAGVEFDTGSDLKEDGVATREWELDWSLKGAELLESSQPPSAKAGREIGT